MTIARVFPHRTRATPDDPLSFVGPPDMLTPTLRITEVHVSVAFTWDLSRAEELAREWEHIAPVKVGGPATGQRSGDFIPGCYLKKGYVITSRGCPNSCWFCGVWRREGNVRELPITEGWNLLDDNILACSDDHIQSVFNMLWGQHEAGHRVEFTGGLEAARLKPWHVEWFTAIKPKQMFFAYDTPDDLAPLVEASKMLREAGFTRNHLRCYVLIGHPRDIFDAAEKRLAEVCALGMFPMAMLWRGNDGARDPEWMKFQKQWARPALIARRMKV